MVLTELSPKFMKNPIKNTNFKNLKPEKINWEIVGRDEKINWVMIFMKVG